MTQPISMVPYASLPLAKRPNANTFQLATAHPDSLSIRFQGNQLSQGLTATQRAYLDQVHTELQRYSVDDVKAWDEAKAPPIALLNRLADLGTYVTAVPVPDLSQADNQKAVAAMLQNPDIQKALGSDKLQRYQRLLQQGGNSPQAKSVLAQLGKDGHSKITALGAIEMAKTLGVGVATFLGVNSGLAAEPIAKIGTDAQKAFYLNGINRGLFTTAFGLTESTVGSDPRSVKSTFKAETDASGKTVYRLNIDKRFIGNAARVVDSHGTVIHPGADFIAVFAVDNPKAPPSQRSYRFFMVPRALIGEEHITTSGGKYQKMGLKVVNNGNIKANDVIVPEIFMLGDPTQPPKALNAYPKLMALLDETRLLVGAMSLGQAEGILETAFQYAQKRQQNGHAIQDFQGVIFPLLKLRAKAAAGRLLVMDDAQQIDEAAAAKADPKSNRFGLFTSMAKLFNSELAEDSAKQAINTLGGAGFMEDPQDSLGLAMRYRDSKVLTIYEGTSNIQRNLIGAGVLMAEQEKAKQNPLHGINMLASSNGFVSTLKQYVHPSRIQKIDAAYDYVVANLAFALKHEFEAIQQIWQSGGTPAVYQGWADQKDIQRQQRMESLLPVQSKLFILADIAVYRKLAQLAEARLDVLSHQGRLGEVDRQQQADLELFLDIANDEVAKALVEFNGNAIQRLETNYRATEHPSV